MYIITLTIISVNKTKEYFVPFCLPQCTTPLGDSPTTVRQHQTKGSKPASGETTSCWLKFEVKTPFTTRLTDLTTFILISLLEQYIKT